MTNFAFKTTYAEDIFRMKYAMSPDDSWPNLARGLVNDVCGDRSLTAKPNTTPLLSKEALAQLTQYIIDQKFIPAGRYLYYARRPIGFFNNCFCLKGEEDTREEWGSLLKRSSDCLMSGGGIGVDYSVFRPSGHSLFRTGGVSSGPVPLMYSINEIGRNVMQGGSRRSAIYASLNWQHGDIQEFVHAKDYPHWIRDKKAEDFNFPAPLDMTNISVNWDTAFLEKCREGDHDHGDKYTNTPSLWYDVIKQMCKTGEPGMSFNFYENEKETLRNACSEFTSEDDSDVCNLGSVNLCNISDITELRDVVNLASKFLVCGTVRGDVPYDKVKKVRDQNRKIGLGLMGVHAWLLQRGYKYEVVPELHQWLAVYRDESERAANEICDRFYLNRPKKYRAVAPAGTISILASSTSGIEPLYAVAYKRRYLEGKARWKYQYVIDATAQRLIDEYGIEPDSIEIAPDLAKDAERRVKFQYDIQKYVDMAISSTLNLPQWGTEFNNEDTLEKYAGIVLRHAHGLRGITFYPDGSRGGQPLTAVPYAEAVDQKGIVYEEEATKGCSSGVCGI